MLDEYRVKSVEPRNIPMWTYRRELTKLILKKALQWTFIIVMHADEKNFYKN